MRLVSLAVRLMTKIAIVTRGGVICVRLTTLGARLIVWWVIGTMWLVVTVWQTVRVIWRLVTEISSAMSV